MVYTVSSLFAQVNDSYNFPIRPGTKEWAELRSYEARLNAYNIPSDVLSKMSTKGLVETCLNYPELRLIMTRNDLQQGYSYVKSIFNGFGELEKRSDAGKELINVYKQMNPKDVRKYTTLLEQGRFGFQFTHLELLLAQKSILANMQPTEKKELIQYCIANYEIKEQLPEFNYMFNLSTPIWVVSRILDAANYGEYIKKKADNTGQKRFVDFAYCNEKSILTEIILISKKYATD